MTEKAAQSVMNNAQKDKEALQQAHENEDFPIFKESTDAAKKRAMARNRSQENYSNHLVNSSKNDKDRYYEKYVE